MFYFIPMYSISMFKSRSKLVWVYTYHIQYVLRYWKGNKIGHFRVTQITPVLECLLIFDLSKSVSQLYLAIYGEKIYFLLCKHLKMVQERKNKSKKNSSKFFFLFCAKSNSIFLWGIKIFKNRILLFFWIPRYLTKKI